MESTITAKGQITLPKALRDHLGAKPGDRLKFFIDPYGHVAILPKLPITALKGLLKSTRGPVSLDEIESGIAEGATARSRRPR